MCVISVISVMTAPISRLCDKCAETCEAHTRSVTNDRSTCTIIRNNTGTDAFAYTGVFLVYSFVVSFFSRNAKNRCPM